MRAGTENTAGIVGLGQAAELAKQEMSDEWERLSDLRDMLIAAVRELGDSWINGDEKYRLPGHVSFGLRGISQDTLLIRLDMAGFAVSAGSACSAGALEPSHVLLAMGQTKEQASSAIRVTLGRFTSVEEVQRFIRKLSLLVGAIRGR